MSSKPTVSLSRGASVGGDSQLLVGDCMEMCLSNWVNSSDVDIPPHLSLYKYYRLFFFAVVLRPKEGHGLLILDVSRSHTTTHHSR